MTADATASHDPVVVTVIVVALLPLLLARFAHDRDRVDELVGEVAIVMRVRPS